MSLLDTIQEELQKGEIILPSGECIPIAVPYEEEYFEIKRSQSFDTWFDRSLTHRVSFAIAPQNVFYGKNELLRVLWKARGEVQFIDGLNALVDNFLPKVKPDEKANFEIYLEEYLHWGRLKFKEVIGKRIIGEEKLIVTDPNLQNRPESANGEKIFPAKEEPLVRVISLTFYPHFDYARICARGTVAGENYTVEEYDKIMHSFGRPHQPEIKPEEGVPIDGLRAFLRERTKVKDIKDIRSKYWKT